MEPRGSRIIRFTAKIYDFSSLSVKIHIQKVSSCFGKDAFKSSGEEIGGVIGISVRMSRRNKDLTVFRENGVLKR